MLLPVAGHVPVPVVLFHATAFTDRRGRALFADDMDGQDAPLIAAPVLQCVRHLLR
jgi:hypothetical protein